MYLIIFGKIFFYFQREGKGGRRRGRETSMCKRNINWLPLACSQLGTWHKTQACALTGNQTSKLSIRRLALSPPSHTSQGYLIIVKFKDMLSYGIFWKIPLKLWCQVLATFQTSFSAVSMFCNSSGDINTLFFCSSSTVQPEVFVGEGVSIISAIDACVVVPSLQPFPYLSYPNASFT